MGETAALEMHTEDSPNPPNLGQVIAIQRPDYVPEKFYDAKTGIVNFEALAKSYGELEKSRSAKPDAATGEPVKPVTEPVKPAPVVAAPAPVVLPTIPGVEAAAITNFTTELNTKGALSAESYAALEKAGYNKTTVDSYIKGIQADRRVEAAVTESVEAARIADKEISSIKAEIGGDKVLGEMQAWAIANMSAKQLAAYNAAVSSPDVEVVRLAVSGLHHQFVKANGESDDKLFKGSGNVGADEGDVFHSRAEQSKAINDPRYSTDPAYRARMSAKMGRSNF